MLDPSKPNKRYTLANMQQQDAVAYSRGYRQAKEEMRLSGEDLKRQKEQLPVERTKAVTDLLRAASENLSKAGYLIGKLNKDNSR